MVKHEESYQEFWKDIVENEDGTLNVEQVKKELADYKILLDEVPKVYDELAGFSKPHTRASVIISAVNDRMIDKQMAYDDLIENAQDGEVTLTTERLKDYFDIKEQCRSPTIKWRTVDTKSEGVDSMFKNWKCKFFGHKKSNVTRSIYFTDVEFTCIRCSHKWTTQYTVRTIAKG